nr:hypothetical protein [Tanacetum cinerariifolium]
ACLLAAYTAPVGKARNPYTDELLTMAPPPWEVLGRLLGDGHQIAEGAGVVEGEVEPARLLFGRASRTGLRPRWLLCVTHGDTPSLPVSLRADFLSHAPYLSQRLASLAHQLASRFGLAAGRGHAHSRTLRPHAAAVQHPAHFARAKGPPHQHPGNSGAHGGQQDERRLAPGRPPGPEALDYQIALAGRQAPGRYRHIAPGPGAAAPARRENAGAGRHPASDIAGASPAAQPAARPNGGRYSGPAAGVGLGAPRPLGVVCSKSQLCLKF